MKTTYIYIILTIVLFGGLMFLYTKSNPGAAKVEASTEFDGFAQCLADAGAKFYGAFWCPHCQEQKAMFKQSAKLPYVECSTPNGENQTQVCIEEEIKSYPTWKFADGSVGAGVLQFAELAEKTNCALPQ